ncbi:MAG: CD3324 family protein [Suilimivivens sp.]
MPIYRQRARILIGGIRFPRKTENKQEWGKRTGIRQELLERNTSIFQEYLKGCRIEELVDKYFLSEKSIQRIIHEMKKTA